MTDTTTTTSGPAIDRTVELFVDGMTCGHCVSAVKRELTKVAGVHNVDVILDADGTSKVTVVTNIDLRDEDLRTAIDEAGYDLVRVQRNV